MADAEPARRFSRDSDSTRVAAEGPDILLDPLQREDLIEKAEAPRPRSTVDVEKARRVEPVVARDDNDAVACERGAVVRRDRARSPHERAAVDPKEHRK